MRLRAAEAMNLGDGLKLETQILNGKTKLILAPYDVQEKTSRQVANRGRAQRTVLKVKHQPHVLHTVQINNEKAEQPAPKSRPGKVGLASGKPPTNVLKELENKKQAPLIQQNAQQAKAEAGKGKPVPKKFSNVPKQRPQNKPTISAEELRESLVCLTQEQFQQILMTINQNNKPNAQDETADEDKKEMEVEENVAPLLLTKEEDSNRGIAEKDGSSSATQPKDVQGGSLFGTLGEREIDKSLQEAKRAQWKRELDEQVALKKKLKEADQEGINFRHREGIESSVSERTPYSDLPKTTPVNDYGTPDSILPGTETTDSSPVERASSFSSPELPAAIRSAFVLGEAAPLDHPFSAVKRQQQKKWLEELNKQREEAAQRKMQEKQKIQEVEQQDLWAMHFDSFKKTADKQSPVFQTSANVQPSAHVSSLEPGPAEYAPTPVINDLQREQPETRLSMDEEYSNSQKAGFLRTMTALLDPAQIDERDRKRQKQLEHQRAIAAQVEENRKRKQLEDEQRQKEEQEEEQRLAKEREQLQKQYEQDMHRQKQKEEVLSMKTRELYQSMQRAQEEAQRLKQEQRMRHLVKKGHDISNLQKNPAGEAIQLDPSRAASRTSDAILEDSRSGANSVMKPSVTTLISPRKDTAVQTDDLDTGIKTAYVSNGPSWRQERNASPDIPVEFTYQQKKAEQPGKKVKPQRDRSESTKENMIDDVYDQYARTEKQPKEAGRKPDWNKNRPQRRYVPASERYPKGLQKQREENKVKRQMELLHLVEKNSSNLSTRKGLSPERSPVPREDAKISHPPEEIRPAFEAPKEEKVQKIDPYFKRSDSPPVPAVKNRLQQRRQNATPAPTVYSGNPISTQMNISPDLDKQETPRPPSSQFVPYVRTKEIYYLDPDAPMSRPSTHDPQYKRAAGDQESRQIFSSDHARDPLLNPNVIRNKDRQQAILRGLSELRKGLLQKQRELETGLMPDV